MTVLTRSDGTPFVIQAYRESLHQMTGSVLQKELRLLAEQHGQYLQLSKKPQHIIEAVFSKEAGYLLAETIWQHFGKPNNLIYCEGINSSAHMLLVVVRAGSVYLDTKILSSQLQEELIPLMTSEQSFRIVTYGDLPLRESNAKTFGGATFAFPTKLVESFEKLDEPLFPSLPKLSDCQLQPLALALKMDLVRSRRPAILLAVTAVVLVMGGWWLLSPNKENVSAPAVNVVQQAANPYAAYDKALKSAAPDEQMHEVVQKLQQLYFVPGWQLGNLQLQNKEFHINMRQVMGGDLALLSQWAKQHYYQFQITPQGAELAVSSHVSQRSAPSRVYQVQPVVMRLVDRLNLLLRDRSVVVSTTQLYGKAKRVDLTVNINGVSPELLDLVGKELKDLPITLSQVDLHVNSGLISGTLQLSAWGS